MAAFRMAAFKRPAKQTTPAASDAAPKPHDVNDRRKNETRNAGALADARFRTLVGEAGWAQLPEPVRRRFSKCLAPDEALVYRGNVVATELSRAGCVFAFMARAIGAPLPLTDGATGPAVVSVVEDTQLGGQCWTRTYARPGRLPQTVHSAKRFRGETGLEEYVGYGIGMALEVAVEEQALVFRSAHYFLSIGRWRWRLPRLMEPGRMEIVHREEGGGTFSFRLRMTHPVLGVLVHQLANFRDT
jgi:Domain of unknown function (DUF4166)